MGGFSPVNVENYVGPTCLINHGPVLSDCKGTLGGFRLDMGLDGQSGHHLVKACLVTNTVDHFFFARQRKFIL